MTPLQITRLAGFGKKPPQIFAQSPVVLGTAAGCGVRFDPTWDKGVAAQHVRLEWNGHHWVLTDLGSSAGTLIAGRPVTQPVPIVEPVEFELGKNGPRCRVEPATETAAQAAPSFASVAFPASAPALTRTAEPAPTPRRKSSPGISAPVIAMVAGGVLLAAAIAAWFLLGAKPAGPGPTASNAKLAPLPPRIDEMPLPSTKPNSSPAATTTTTGGGKYRLGLNQPSPALQTWIRKSFSSVTSVQLNPLGKDRTMATHNFAVPPPSVQAGRELTLVKGEPSDSTFAMSGSDEPPLPAAVDNSQLPCFPGVGDQGNLGSCASFSNVYYAASHNFALVRGLKKGTGQMRPEPLSPRWTYPMVNNGGDNGSMFLSVLMLLRNHGVPTMREYPYAGDPNPPSNYLGWSTDPAIWRSALHNRSGEVGRFIHLDTEEGQKKLKAFLANGYLATYGTQVLGWEFQPAATDPAGSATGNACAGQPVCVQCDSDRPGGHAMTIVGYNDDLWVDINGNGKVDPGEKGAFKIVNSWGNAEWPQGSGNTTGFAWISYDALKAHSAVPGVNEKDRIPVIMFNEAWAIVPQAEYKPTFLAQFTLSNAKRNEIDVRLGISTTVIKSPAKVWRASAITISDIDPEAVHDEPDLMTIGMGGPLAFDGSEQETPGTFVFDLTDLVASFTDPLPDNQYRFYLIVTDLKTGNPTTIKDFSITDGDGKVLAQAPGLPKQVDNDTMTLSVDTPLPKANPAPTPAP